MTENENLTKLFSTLFETAQKRLLKNSFTPSVWSPGTGKIEIQVWTP